MIHWRKSCVIIKTRDFSVRDLTRRQGSGCPLTRLCSSRGRGRPGPARTAPAPDTRSACRWWPSQCSPAGRWIHGCSAASSAERCRWPSPRTGHGRGQFSWSCRCACGWCSPHLEEGWRMRCFLWAAWKWHLGENNAVIYTFISHMYSS